MSFADIEPRKSSESTFRKFDYFVLSQGRHTIRILSNKAVKYETHWLNNSTILCLGDDCLICKQNKIMMNENPGTFRNVKGWNPARRIYFVNVLDRTVVKTCTNPECQAEIKKEGSMWPPKCPNCDTMLGKAEEHQSNKVKVLNSGVDLFGQINGAEGAILNATGESLDINQVDFNLVVTGVKKDRRTIAFPNPVATDVVTVPEESLFDVSNAVIKLTVAETREFLRGVSLKDIFATRKATTVETTQEVPIDQLADIKKRASTLLD